MTPVVRVLHSRMGEQALSTRQGSRQGESNTAPFIVPNHPIKRGLRRLTQGQTREALERGSRRGLPSSQAGCAMSCHSQRGLGSQLVEELLVEVIQRDLRLHLDAYTVAQH